MRKWIVLAAGVVLQTILGGIYAWSAFVPSLTSSYGLTKGQCGLIFGVMIAVFTMAMIPAGRLLQKHGPRVTAGVGAILFATGYILASFSGGSFPALLAGLGLVSGAGIGFGYVCPLTVGMQWFPKNKGLVTGVAVAGFGGGAILLSSLTVFLLDSVHINVLSVFRVVGIVLGGVAFVSAMAMSEPERRNRSSARSAPQRIGTHLASATFWLICLGMFAGTFAGLLAVGNLKPLALSMGLDGRCATLSITLFAIGNAVGRIFWGQLHDRLGSQTTIILSLGVLGVALFPFLLKPQTNVVLLAALVSGVGFGGCFVVYAASIVEYFGVVLFPRLYPLCFLGYGLAGLTGPGLGGWIADATGSYSSAVIMSISIVFLAQGIVGFGLGKAQTSTVKEIVAE